MARKTCCIVVMAALIGVAQGQTRVHCKVYANMHVVSLNLQLTREKGQQHLPLFPVSKEHPLQI